MKYYPILSCAIFLILLSACTAGNEEVRTKINLNREWKFICEDIDNGQVTDIDDNSWLDIHLPHSFSIPYFMSPKIYNGYGWYRKEFEIPASWKDKNITLEFEGSFIETEVYVNGEFTGKHVGGYTGFFFDITKHVKTGKNLIAVRVNNLWKPDVAPRAGDHQFSGGIYRDVYLNVIDKLHIDWCGTFITTPVADENSAVCNVKIEIRNNYNDVKTCTVKTEIKSPDGKVVSIVETDGTVNPAEVKVFEQSFESIDSPHLWSPENPELYTAVTTVSLLGAVVDRYETKFGIRRFEWKADSGFFLNGQHYYLFGANVHQDQAGWGDAVTNAAIRRDVQMIKDAGFNCIRGSHYPHDPAFSQACDEIGLILLQENAFWGMGGSSGDSNGWGTPSSSCYPPDPEYQDNFDKSVLLQLDEMIKIHRNYASIAAWSMSNEPFFTDDSTTERMKELLKKSVRKAKESDPSREAAIGGAQRGDIDKLDIDGITPIAFYNGDGASREEFQNPGIPNLVSEYGSTTAYRPGRFLPGWGDIVEGHIRPEWRSGHIIWCGFDHGTVGGVGLATMGMVDYFRLPKRQYHWYVEAYKNGTSSPNEPLWPEAGVPAKLKIEASNTIIKSPDGTDDAQVIITVLDSVGNHISNNVPVELEIVSGPGEFPTGRKIRFMPPSDDEMSDITIRDGQAAIAFRSYHGGKSILKASSEGLEEAIIEIITEGIPKWVEGVTKPVADRPYKRYKGENMVPVTISELLLAKDRPSWVSSAMEGTYKAFVNDGDNTTVWKPEKNDPEKWWKLHLEASYCINRIEIEFPTTDAYKYIVEVSSDEMNWNTVIDQTHTTNKEKKCMAYGNLGRNVAFFRIRFISEAAGLAEVRIGGAPELPEKPNLLTGIIIGTAGSWNGNATTVKEAAMDFDMYSYFDASSDIQNPWVGLDLGNKACLSIKQIRYVPRDGMAARMTGGKFQVANSPDFSDAVTIYTIKNEPSNSLNIVNIPNSPSGRYVRYLSPKNSNGNIAELEFYGKNPDDE